MRFLADGPMIPDELLIARDEGRVIFFCGAGVSRARAGLLDFFGLAEKVTDSLGVTADDPVRKLITEARDLDLRIGISGLISADRVFGLLERDFLVREIESSVANALKPTTDVDLSAHRIMLDLAKSTDGKTRLVTTNFDLLFESCDDSLPCHRSPRLPDPMRNDEFEGIIHLHGHVDKEYRGAFGEFSALLAEPLETLLGKARELSGRMDEGFVEKDPFAGLASERPIRAFSALNNSAKQGEWPEWAWRKFLYSSSREKDKPPFSALIAHRISTYPVEAVAGFVYPVSDWLQKSSKILLADYPEQFERVWSKIVSVLKAEADISKTSLVRGNKEPAWATEALNAPVGKLAQALMNDPQKEGLKAGKGFPIPWTNHVEELLGLPGDHRRYALVMLAFNLNWFFNIDSSWTDKNLLSALESEDEDQEAFWDGFFWASRVPDEKLYLRLQPWLLQLALHKHVAGRREVNVLSGILLAGWGSIQKKTGKRFISNDEMRNVLLNADDEFRGQIIWQLERWSSEKGKVTWKTNLPLFFTEVWPKQKQAKSPKMSAKLCDLAFSNEAVFPIIADIILPLLTKIDEEGFLLPHLRGTKTDIVAKFPEKTLALLWAVLPENATKWTYGIEDVLVKIAEAEPSLLNNSRLIELKRRWSAR